MGRLCPKGHEEKGNRMVPNCVPAGGMKEGGLKKWFNEKWVDIGSKKKVEDIKNVEENLQVIQKENIQNVYLLLKLQV